MVNENWDNYKKYSWSISICLCLYLCSAATVSAITESQAQKLYNDGVNLYRLGTLGQPGINVKEALKHNFQGLVDALKEVNRYIAAHPHDKDRYVPAIRLLLIHYIQLAEAR